MTLKHPSQDLGAGAVAAGEAPAPQASGSVFIHGP